MAIRRTRSYPALALAQNKQRFYFATIPIEDLFEYCFISHREADPTHGFQRSLSEPRARDIAQYLASGSGSIPTNIVLSAQPEASLEYNSRIKSLAFKRVSNAFLVLDGQHRLWGYHLCSVRHRVPVAIYEGLSRSEEARLFIDINTNQRGVPAALLLDIKALADLEQAEDATLRQLFDRMNTDPECALSGKMSAAKSAVNRISRVTFRKALTGALKSSLLQGTDFESIYRVIRNYVNAFDAELNDKELITRSAFFEAIFDIFDEVLRASMSLHKNLKQPSLQRTVRSIAKLDYSVKGRLAKRPLLEMMQAAFRSSAMKISKELV